MNGSLARAAIGFTGAALISVAARRAHALSRGGAVAATIAGGTIVAGAGARAGVTLVAFFLSSTLLGRLPAAPAIEQRRGNERDAVQVTANGGIPALLAGAAWVTPQEVRPLLSAGIGGSIAAATADTWATEVGFRSRQRPRSIATLKPVAPGASGGVTIAGLAASAAGAAFIGIVASSGLRQTKLRHPQALSVAAGGIAGGFSDSMLGATIQEVRFCDFCMVDSEQRIHRCGTPTRHIRGLSWCNNDTVNAIATAVGAVTAISIDVAARNRAALHVASLEH